MADKVSDVLSEMLAANGGSFDNTEVAQENQDLSTMSQDTSDNQSDNQEQAQEQIPEQNPNSGNSLLGVQGADTNAAPDSESELKASLLKLAEAYRESQNQLRQLQEQNSASSQVIQQQSAAAQEAVDKLMMPKLDVDAMQYMSDTERSEAMDKYYADMEAYNERKFDEKMKPMKDFLDEQIKRAEKERAIGRISKIPEYSGFSESLSDVEKIIEKTPELQNVDSDKRYQIAFLIDRGIKSIQNAKPESTEELVKKVSSNPDAMKAILAQQAQQVAQSQENIPRFSVSMGQSTSPANVDKRPQTLAEARERLFKKAGINNT